ERADGRVKLYLIWQALDARRRHPALQPGGGYLPLTVTGSQAEHVCAFARLAPGGAGDHVIVIAPRWFTRLEGPDGLPPGPEVWEDGGLILDGVPAAAGYRSVFTGEAVPVKPDGPTLPLASALASFPVALLEPAGQGR